MEGFVIKCEFCQQTPLEVVESNCCSSIYCWNCILEKKICKCGSIINIEKVAVVPELQEILDQNTLDYCKLPGCNFTANRKLIREHANNCEYRVVPCPSHPECGTFIFKNLVEHQEVCPHAIVHCECGQTLIRQQLENHNCPESLVDCKCGIQVKNRFLKEHENLNCPETFITCPFAKYGCTYFGSRANVNIHSNEAQEAHLQILENYDFNNAQEIRRLKAQINLPLGKQVCNVTKRVSRTVITTIPESRLVKRGLHLVDNCRKETLFKILFFFFLATLLPMKFFLVRFIFTTIVMRKVWVVLFGPAIRSARYTYSRSCTAAVEQMIYLALFIILTVLFAFYSKFL